MYKGFTKIENSIIADTNITDSEFRTYAVIRSFWFHNNQSEGSWPAQSLVAKIQGKNKRSIVKHVKTLTQKGYIEKVRRGFNMTNLYTFPGAEYYTFEEKKNAHQDSQNVHFNKSNSNNINTNTNKSENTSEIIAEIRQKLPFLRKNR